ncbi:arabinose ABC transporter permease [Mesotoga sp. Brook.08.105.5.1]|uniref:MFS transporter n=1 Tax=Mesotoga sp. Brook.08.105.5.1 TaxID=1421002 RepID=UPI000C183A77|nr:MFS transporter [Mesotoga sp. Brook.08.105.5.1]PVD17955.1 arabinose ABC transporter permease [Mesotoga sp. Brook.08.105.5.1]
MRKRIVLLLTYTFITTITISMYRVVYNLYLREIGFSNQLIGNVTSAQLWGSAIIGLLTAVLADSIGKKKILFLSAIVVPVSGIALAFVVDPTFIIVLSFIKGGFTVTAFTVVMATMTSITKTGNRAKVFGLNFGINMASGVIGNFIGGAFGDLFSLKTTLIISMVAHLPAIIPVIKLEMTESRSRLKELFNFSGLQNDQRKVLTYYFISTATVGFGAGLFIHFGNLIFKDLFNMSATAIGIALSIAQLGTAAGSTLSHKLGKRFGALKFNLTMQLLVIPLMLSLVIVREPILFTILYAFRFVFMNITNPIMTSIIFSYVPDSKLSTVSGINGFLNNTVRAVAAMIFGLIVGTTISGYTELFLLSTAFYAANAFIIFLFYRDFKNEPRVLELYDSKRTS